MVLGDVMTDGRQREATSEWRERIEAAVQRTLDDMEEQEEGTQRRPAPVMPMQERHSVASVYAPPASALGAATTRR